MACNTPDIFAFNSPFPTIPRASFAIVSASSKSFRFLPSWYRAQSKRERLYNDASRSIGLVWWDSWGIPVLDGVRQILSLIEPLEAHIISVRKTCEAQCPKHVVACGWLGSDLKCRFKVVDAFVQPEICLLEIAPRPDEWYLCEPAPCCRFGHYRFRSLVRPGIQISPSGISRDWDCGSTLQSRRCLGW